jgi:tripartite-type tricarboxylate transporter receptor subunit TctC
MVLLYYIVYYYGGGGGAAALGYMAAAALDTGFCHLIGSISIFNLLDMENMEKK